MLREFYQRSPRQLVISMGKLYIGGPFNFWTSGYSWKIKHNRTIYDYTSAVRCRKLVVLFWYIFMYTLSLVLRYRFCPNKARIVLKRNISGNKSNNHSLFHTTMFIWSGLYVTQNVNGHHLLTHIHLYIYMKIIKFSK